MHREKILQGVSMKRSKCVRNVFTLLMTYVLGLLSMFMILQHSNIHLKLEIRGSMARESDGSNDKKQDNSPPHDSQKIQRSQRILCWIMTTPNNHKTKALSIKETWGKRCDVNLFISSATDVTLPTVALNVSEGRDNLWAKTKAAFEHVYQNYSKKADWFLKADDDTYVIIENLRQFLQDKNASEPLYFGKRLKPHLTQGYMSGGAGYVLSHKALERLVTEGFRNSSICETQKRKDEDLEIGKCFDHLGIVPGDTRDDKERERFMSYRIEQHLYPHLMLPLTRNYSYYPQKKGLECCSDTPISFHYIPHTWMLFLEYFLYGIHIHGAKNSTLQTLSHQP